MSSDATSTVPTSLPPISSLDNTFDDLLIGAFVGLILAGLMLHQTFVYFPVYTKDGFHLKCMIWLLRRPRLLVAGNTIVTMHACYYNLVANYFDPLALLDGVCVNSRRSLTDSAMHESDFGTFGLGPSQQNSMRIPARLEHFRAPRSEGEVIGISSWKAPADAKVKHAKIRMETTSSAGRMGDVADFGFLGTYTGIHSATAGMGLNRL
ncbi:hypothetical protein BD311DRAFT_831514 [Dichomitus squalens]|uniref:Uncharacterized protein n=1 Tax=Dichomitus squalens TaxID=114155 RepID=A0A4Q9M3K3_9APHY|nr:hypothetical protein BD311DRAFT_831514 [Dichomitus squalens]